MMKKEGWLGGLMRLPLALIPLFVIALFGLAQIFKAQSPAEKPASDDHLSGKYVGMVKSSSGVDTRWTLEIKNDNGKVSGRLVTPQGATPISEGTFADGKLALKFGTGNTTSKLSAHLQDDKLTGNWAVSGQTLPVELKKVLVVDNEASATVLPSTPAALSLSGEWDGIADAQGQDFPFTLSLKVEGEKVSGETSSSLGIGTISSGSWKDGRLVFQLDTPSGIVAMSAIVKDGGLVGEFDFAGQMQGRWVATKRNP